MEELLNYKVAYFSLEIALESRLKSYAGGLGILAGDLLRSAADLRLPLVGVSLLNDQGYFKQVMTKDGQQIEEPVADYDFSKLIKLPVEVTVNIGRESVRVVAWQYLITSQSGQASLNETGRRSAKAAIQPTADYQVPVILLDTNCAGNSTSARQITRRLYGGQGLDRLKQKIILGRAGVKILQALGYNSLQKFHLNEGHGVFAAVEDFLSSPGTDLEARLEMIRQKCIFTTHTPVNEAINTYDIQEILEYQPDFPVGLPGLAQNGQINMARVGLYFSHYSNAVSQSHQRTAQKMFPEYKLQAITNGVHSATWTAPEFQKLYNQYLPGWQADEKQFLQAGLIPTVDLKKAHQQAKHRLLQYIYQSFQLKWSEEIFTLGLARRFTPYKRLDLIFRDLERLLAIQKASGLIQIVCAGKAHPQDQAGQAMIKPIHQIKQDYKSRLALVFLEDYDIEQAQLITAGVDVLLNTPLPPLEASGTSGMKAAHNGVPQLSTLDGWWSEGYLAGQTGWAIGQGLGREADPDIDAHDAARLYELLEKEILPLYYQQPEKWAEMSRSTIVHNAPIFNTHRALKQYWREAYQL